jgi:hypothetical protein
LLGIETGKERMGENLKKRIVEKKTDRNVKERLERILMLAEKEGLVACLVKNKETFKYPSLNCLSSTNSSELPVFLVVDKVIEIPSCVIRIGHWDLCKPSGPAVALGTNQPTTQMSSRDISWRVKAADA